MKLPTSTTLFATLALGAGSCPVQSQPCAVGEPIKPVRVQFVSNEGTATLVGFEEFTNPSSPPRKFRRRQVTGSMTVEDFPYSASCESCPSEVSLVWEGSIYWSPPMRATGSLVVESRTDTTVTYVGQGIDVVDLSSGQSGYVGSRLASNYGYLGNGSRFTVPVGTQVNVQLQIYYLFMTTVASGCVTAGQPPAMNDSWSLVETINPETGAATLLNDSTRRIGTNGTLSPLVYRTPGECYRSGVAQTVTATQRTSRGVGCTGGTKFTGSVSEDLSEPDTDEDAEARAVIVEGSSNVAYRVTRTLFSFPFCRVQYSADFAITCPGDYIVAVHYTVKPHGGTGDGESRVLAVRQRFEAGLQTVKGRIDPKVKDTDYAITAIDARPAPGCGTNPTGEGNFDIGSVKAWIALGGDVGGLSAGGLMVDESNFSARLYSPVSLQPVIPDGASFNTIRDASGVLRQVRAPQALADVVRLGTSSYEVRLYASAQVGAQDTMTGIYSLSGAPFVVYRFENPDLDRTTRLRITETRGATAKVVEYAYDAAANTWSLSHGAERTETESLTFAGTDKIKTRSVWDGTGTLASVTARTYRQFAWGEELVREVLDPAVAALTTNYEFYDAVPTSDPNYKRLRQRTDANGNWERLSYDATGRVAKTIQPFLNTPPTSTDEAACRVVVYIYDSLPDLDGDGLPEARTLTVERTLGVETARRFRIDWSKLVTLENDACQRRSEIVCTVSGASWDASSNLVTETLTLSTGIFAGRQRRAINPDGTATLTTYSVASDGVLTTTTKSGQANAAHDDILDGRRTIAKTNASGQVSQQTFDIVSGLSLSLWVTTQFDALGRATRIDFDDGTYTTREYACCGLSSERDRFGVTTTFTYDGLGRQFTQTRLGITTKRGYDADGRTTSVRRIGTDGSEIVQESNVYDVAGRLVEVRDALNRRTSYAEVYDSAAGTTTRTTTNPDGGTSIEVLARDGSRMSVGGTATAPRTWAYGVDADGVFTKEIRPGLDANNQPTVTEWTQSYVDFAGRPAATVFADGARAFSIYNAVGKLIRQTDPDGVTVLSSYNGRGEQNVTAVDLDANGAIDLTGRDRITRTDTSVVSKSEDGASYTVTRTTVQQWETDSQDVPTLISTSEQTADGRRQWQTTRGLTTRTVMTLDGVGGRVVVTTAPDGVKTTQSFMAERLLSATSTAADGTQLARVDYAYDEHGRVQSITDARNGVTRFTYFADDQVKSVTTPDPDTNKSGAGYDPQTTIYAYDESGRVQFVTLPDGGVVNTTYWPTGAVKRTWGARTYPAEYSYDPQGRVKTLTTWRDFAANTGTAVTTWDYDAKRGWLERKRYADGTGPAYSYYASGRLRTRTWARSPVVTTTYGYTPAGEVAFVRYSDRTPNVDLVYDRTGRPKTITDGTGTRTFFYHASGEVGNESYSAGTLNGFVMEREFDALQRVNGLTLRNAQAAALQHTGYVYDPSGRLGLITSGTNTVTYGYAANSALVETNTFKNGENVRLAVTRAYDRLNRITGVSSVAATGAVMGRSYLLDGANQRTRATLADGNYWSYAYDALGQVTGAKKSLPDGTAMLGDDHSWTFDSIGNRRTAVKNGASSGYVANALNEYSERSVPGTLDVTGAASASATVTVAVNNAAPVVTTRQGERFYRRIDVDNTGAAQTVRLTITGVKNDAGPAGEDVVTSVTRNVFVPKSAEVFLYDTDGNLTDDARWHYSWDAENRLAAMETNQSALAVGEVRKRLEFVYDGGSRRSAKKVFGWNGSGWALDSHTVYVYDGWNMVAELNALAGLAPIRTYAWGLDVSGTFDAAGGVGGLVAINDVASGGTHFPSYDGNGNVIGLVSAAEGSVTATYDYNAFGEPAATEGTFANANPFRFSTKYADAETGILYYSYRYYDANTGRWLNMDPAVERGGMNVYEFVENAPTRYVDKLGLLLAAVDGTGSWTWRSFDRKAGRWNSHVRNFFMDYQGPGPKQYWDGPANATSGSDSPDIHKEVIRWICTVLKGNPSEPINLIGHSRGGYITMQIAKELKDRGCSCIAGPVNKTAIRVNFIGLYDPVDMVLGYGDGESVSSNVDYAANALGDPKVGSRPYFNTANRGAEDISKMKSYEEKIFDATHGGMGGDPWGGDHPRWITEARDRAGSAAADAWVRQRARNAGIKLRGSP